MNEDLKIVKESESRMTEYEVLDDHWYQLSNYSDSICVGIVKIKINNQIKSYIGTASGLDRELDIKRIVASGKPFYSFM